MPKSIWGDEPKQYNIGFSVLAVLATVFAVIILIYIWGYIDATSKLKYFAQQAVSMQDKLLQIEKENLDLREKITNLSKPLGFGDKLIYQNSQYGFRIELPGEYKILEQDINHVIAESKDGIEISIKASEASLDSLQYVAHPGSYVWEYSVLADKWVQKFGNNAPANSAPVIYDNDTGLKIYRAANIQDAVRDEIAYAENPHLNNLLIITVSESADAKQSRADKIMDDILGSLDFAE